MVLEEGPEERNRLWPLLVAMYTNYDEFGKKATREIPVILPRAKPDR